MENIKKVTCVFYTSEKDIERYVSEKLVCSGIVPDGLIKTNITDASMRFRIHKNLIVVTNQSQVDDSVMFNLEKIDPETIENKDNLLSFAHRNYINIDAVTTHMAYKKKSDYNYEGGEKVYSFYKYYNTPYTIYDLNNEREKELLYKRNFNGKISAYYLCTKEINGSLIGSLAPVKGKFYIRFIESQPSNMLNKFFNGTLGSKEEYEDKEYIEGIFKRLDKTIDKSIESKNYNILSTILKNLIINNIANYKMEYDENNNTNRYNVVNKDFIKLEESYYSKIITKIRKTLTDRNLSDMAESILTSGNISESLNKINNNKDYNRSLSVNDYIVRDIIKGTSFLPDEYDDFLFNKPHNTEFEIFKARAIRIILDCYNSNERYYSSYSNDSWNLNLCRNATKQLNNLFLTDGKGELRVPNSEFLFDYNSYKYYIEKDKTKFIFNTFTEEQQNEIFDIFKHIAKVFFINKELPCEISSISFSYINIALDIDFYEKFKTALLDALESHTGRETNTVKSILLNEIYIDGENIFNNLDKKYVKLRQLQMKNKLQR